MRYAVILAGGAGKRLWPLSRMTRPKQLLSLIDGKTLLGIAVERLKELFDDQNIFIVTNAEYAEQVAATLGNLPPENIIGEPQGRDTAAAIALAAELLALKDPEAVMAVFTADHIIRPEQEFIRCVGHACETAEKNPGALVTYGIRPDWPHTGLGYIECVEDLGEGLHRVGGFKEKPNHQLARRYVESGKYYWNSGMFTWKLGAIRGALEQFLPETFSTLRDAAQRVCAGEDLADVLADVYPTLEKISIDFAVMEKAQSVFMIELTCQWLDVGSWPALSDVVTNDDAGNVVIAEEAAIVDSFRNVIVSEDDHLLAVLGMDDCIVAHSKDATLVCNKSDSQRLKDLVALLEDKYGQTYS